MKTGPILLALYLLLVCLNAVQAHGAPDPAPGARHVHCVNYTYRQNGTLTIENERFPVFRIVHVPCRDWRWYGPWRFR